VRGTTREPVSLDRALAESGLEDRHTLVVDAETPVVPPAAATRVGEEEPRDDEIDLEVASGPGEFQFIVYQDEDGVTSLHFPQRPPGEETEALRRNGPALCRYRIRFRRPHPSPAPTSPRGFVGLLAKKVLKVVVGRILAGTVGRAVYGTAFLWENRARPFEGLHGGVDAAALLASAPRPLADGPPLGGGPALLFLHGTTSSTAGAFGELVGSAGVGERLWRAYGGRVAGFNHHTLTKTVAQNALDLRRALAAEPGPIEADVICHSRGGLLARALKELPLAEVARLAGVDVPEDVPPLRIRKVVFVATPNDGTALADPANIPAALDRLATLVSLFPDAAPTLALGAVLSWAGYTAAAGLKALPGLADMAPGSPLLTALGAAPSNEDDYWAVTSDYEPGEPLLRAFVDSGVDRLFGNVSNDLVVPAEGVSTFHGTRLAAPRVTAFGRNGGGAVMHTRFFRERATWGHIERALL
jgi:hypothetical protein